MKSLGLTILLLTGMCSAQLTILNIPSADVTGSGHINSRLDSTYNPNTHNFSSTPNFMFGVGKGTELNLNVNTISYPYTQAVNVESGFKTSHVLTRIGKPTVDNFGITKKGEFVSLNGMDFFTGVKFSNTIANGTSSFVSYTYVATSLLYYGSRFTSGAWTSYSYSNKTSTSGAILGYEYVVNDKFTVATDWSSGSGPRGYTTVGIIYNLGSKWMLMPAYQLGNTGLIAGNHQAALFIGFVIK